MPKVVPLSEFTRNQSSVIEELARTGEPMYLTRNGYASVVVIDAEAYDREQRAREEERKERERERELRELEERIAWERAIYPGLMEGIKQMEEGRVLTLAESDARIRAKKGW